MFEVLEHIPNAEEAMFRIKDAFKSKIAFFQYQTQAHYMIELDC